MQIKNGRPWRLDKGDSIHTPAWPSITSGTVVSIERDEVLLAIGNRLTAMRTVRRHKELHLVTDQGYDLGIVSAAKGTLFSPVPRLTRQPSFGTF